MTNSWFNAAVRANRFRGLLLKSGLLAWAMLIAACGGDDDVYDSVLAAVFEDEEDQLGFFLPSEHFHNRCEFPRSRGESGATEADRQGTLVDEKNFLRSYIHETYLWYDEVEYLEPSDEQYLPWEYFFELTIPLSTLSGDIRDRYSRLGTTAEFEQIFVEGIEYGYGFEQHSQVENQEVVVYHVEPRSPAARNGLSRGARIVSVNGRRFGPVDIVGFLYPLGFGSPGEVEFEVRDLGSTTTRTFKMGLAEYIIDPVQFTRVIETDTGPVGYIFFSRHNAPSEKELLDAFRELAEAEVTDLVLDLRYNDGGLFAVAAEVAAMIAAPSAASGKVFERTQFNDKHPTHDPVFGEPIEPVYFPTTAHGFSADSGTPLPNLNLSRVFIATTFFDTCGASESMINGLRGIDVEVILIGDATCGNPYGSLPKDNCGIIYSPVQYQRLNHKGFGAYRDGFAPRNASRPGSVPVPGCVVADDPEHALGDVHEAHLAAALRYRSTGSCPAPPDRLATEPLGVGPMGMGNMPRNIRISKKTW